MLLKKLSLVAMIAFFCSCPLWAESYLRSTQTYSDGSAISWNESLTRGAIIGSTNTGAVGCHSVGMVNGTLQFTSDGGGYPNTARLLLHSDLTLGSTATFSGPATIEGGGHTLRLTGSMVLRRSLAVVGKLTIDGQGNTLELANTGQFKLTYDNARTSTLRIKNTRLLIGDGMTVTSSTSILPSCYGTLELENVDIYLKGSTAYLGNTAFLSMYKTVKILGGGGTIYLAPLVPCLGVAASSTLYVGPNITLDYSVPNGSTFFGCAASSATLYFDGCTVGVGSSTSDLFGWELQKGRVIFDNHVVIDNYRTDGIDNFYNTDSSRGLILGNNGNEEVHVVLTSAAQVEVLGCLVHSPRV